MSYDNILPILVIGCGNMGSALVKGWLKAGVAVQDIVIIEKNLESRIWNLECRVFDSLDKLPKNFFPKSILLAVKPQSLEEVFPDLIKQFPSSIYITVVAGKNISFYKEHLQLSTRNSQLSIVRVMPNTPALIGKGVSVCVSENVSAAQQKEVTKLLSCVGNVHWLDDEDKMHAVTALSGSGPAYIFYLLDCLSKNSDLPIELARTLTIETVIGACKLAQSSSDSLEELRHKVTSKGGTTQAGLEILMNKDTGLNQLISRTLKAAEKRSREL